MTRTLTKKQKTVLKELGSVLEVISREAEKDDNFADYLRDELGDCWGMSIDEMMTAVQCRTTELSKGE